MDSYFSGKGPSIFSSLPIDQDSQNDYSVLLNLERKTVERNAFIQIRKSSVDPYNRLHSIVEDANFVRVVYEHYSPRQYPLLANLRCGAWYADPSYASKSTAYFKSSDGHYNGWSFNLRRPNLHILPLIEAHYGIMLVDSTRAGKRMPDSFSKTVPIWCAVINRALKLKGHVPTGNDIWDTALHTAPQSVSKQEHSQIEERLEAWAKALADSSYVLPLLSKPLRPIWITPASSSFPELGKELSFYPIVCISASKLLEEGLDRRREGYSYVQGSGDDHEHWSFGLTPTLFWEHKDELLSVPQEEMSGVIDRIVSEAQTDAPTTTDSEWMDTPTGVKRIGDKLLLCCLAEIPTRVLEGKDHPPFPCILLRTGNSQNPSESIQINTDFFCVPISMDKKAAERAFKSSLSPCLDFAERHLQRGQQVCVACETGNDLSVGVAVAALQAFFDDDGNLDIQRRSRNGFVVNKNTLRTRLQWIIASKSDANPSRATLKRVNEFFMSSPYKS